MKSGSHSTSLRADPLVSCPAAGSYSGCHRGAVRVSPSTSANGRRAPSLRRHQSTAPAHAQDAGHTFALALSSVSRREGKWSHTRHLPSLSRTHAHMHTHACARPSLFSCQAQSTKLRPPANSSNPPWANLTECSRCLLPNTKKNILPSGVWAHHWAAHMGHRKRAGQVTGVGLPADVGSEHMQTHTPGEGPADLVPTGAPAVPWGGQVGGPWH